MASLRKSKQTTQLPDRSALRELAKTERTLLDYGKLSPITPREPKSNTILNLGIPPKR